ncbi:hypothetical protein ACP275_09G028100 [Erythranthe tilingii]
MNFMAPQLVFAHIFLVLFVHSYVVSSIKIPSNMKFLNPLRVQKGDKIKGVVELKKYLTYLGYLNRNNCSNNQKLKNDNIFDKPLQLALKKYQKFYNLNVTGVLDSKTVAKMHKPRCAMPDYYNHSCKNVKFLTTDSLYAFLPGQPRWKKRILKYAFSASTPKEAILPIELAFKEWASVTNFKFEPTRKFDGAHVRILFLHGQHGDDLPFGGPEPVGGVAHSYPPPIGEVHFDAGLKWSNKGERNAFDIKTVGLHELGHILGLGHSSDANAVMYPIVHLGETKKLDADDIKGIKALYKLK